MLDIYFEDTFYLLGTQAWEGGAPYRRTDVAGNPNLWYFTASHLTIPARDHLHQLKKRVEAHAINCNETYSEIIWGPKKEKIRTIFRPSQITSCDISKVQAITISEST